MFEVMMKQKQQRNESNGASFTQQSANTIDPNWILLDTCSTDNVFCNSDLLSNIRNCNSNEELHLLTNGGYSDYNQIGHCDLFDVDVHYNPNSIANVLSFDKISDMNDVHVTVDTSVDKSLVVHIGADKILILFHAAMAFTI